MEQLDMTIVRNVGFGAAVFVMLWWMGFYDYLIAGVGLLWP